MKSEQELVVITKVYDLILWSCNHTSRFPRNHRFVLGERIERNLYGLLETLKVCKLSDGKNAAHLDILAAAHAEVGNFVKAVKWQKKAIDLLPKASSFIADGCRKRLSGYQKKQPYREEYVLRHGI